MSKEGIPQFSPEEFKRRYKNVRTMMDREGFDTLLVFGHSGNRQHNHASVHYLAGVAPRHESYLIFPKEGEPTLFITHNNHLASAKEVSVLDDVRRTAKQGRDSAPSITQEIKGKGFGSVGVVGTVYYQVMDAVRRELPSVEWADATGAFREIRARKSEEELAFQRKAAGACDDAIEAMTRELRPGIEERELEIISEKAAWAAGCEPQFLYLNSTPMAASESCVPNQNISRRKIQMGDVINTELSASYGLYSAQILRPFFMGDPTSDYAKLYDVAKKVYDQVAALLKPGTRTQDIYEATSLIPESGYTTVDGLFHGFGVDILPPSVRSLDFPPPPRFVFEENMTVVIQPNPTTKDERMGVQLGDMGVITGEGFERMHRVAPEVIRCG